MGRNMREIKERREGGREKESKERIKTKTEEGAKEQEEGRRGKSAGEDYQPEPLTRSPVE